MNGENPNATIFPKTCAYRTPGMFCHGHVLGVAFPDSIEVERDNIFEFQRPEIPLPTEEYLHWDIVPDEIAADRIRYQWREAVGGTTWDIVLTTNSDHATYVPNAFGNLDSSGWPVDFVWDYVPPTGPRWIGKMWDLTNFPYTAPQPSDWQRLQMRPNSAFVPSSRPARWHFSNSLYSYVEGDLFLWFNELELANWDPQNPTTGWGFAHPLFFRQIVHPDFVNPS